MDIKDISGKNWNGFVMTSPVFADILSLSKVLINIFSVGVKYRNIVFIAHNCLTLLLRDSWKGGGVR